MFLLSKHPDVQRRLFEEITASSDIQSLPYIEAVIKESLRLYPSVPGFSRKTKQPIKIGKRN